MRFNGAPILVVDDEPGIRDLLKDNLEEQGYVCHTAPDGDAALNVLAEQTVQLALVDIMMPGMTGLSLFERVRERYPDLAVIFVTAWDDLNIAVQNLKNGAYDYVVKPVTRKRLQQAVEETLAKREALLEKKQRRSFLHEQIVRQARELESRTRELDALNGMFQSDVSSTFAVGLGGAKPEPEDNRLHQRIMSLQESLKKRISEYLHGHVQSRLLVLEHRLGQCQELVSRDPEQALVQLESIRAELRSVQEEDIRRASHELYPSIVKLGIAPSLRSQQDRFRSMIHVELYTDAAIERDERRDRTIFSEEFKVGIYRIVEGSLDNVVKHATAKMVQIELYYQAEKNVCLVVSDDGGEFDVDDTHPKSGLQAMKDCAETMGGMFQVSSISGRGSRIQVTLPVPARAARPT